MGLLVKLEASERECKKLRKERSGEGSGIRLVIGYVDERFKLVFHAFPHCFSTFLNSNGHDPVTLPGAEREGQGAGGAKETAGSTEGAMMTTQNKQLGHWN